MYILYDLIFLLIAIIYLPIYLFRRKFHRGFLSRFGILPKDLKLDQPIWVHAVSVGEAMVVRGLISELRKVYPEKKFFISTVTPTGNKIAKTIAKSSDFVSYLPLDFSFIVKSALNKIKPSLLILAETEIWPNLISSLATRNIPLIVVNGRISDSSFRGYLMIKFLLKPILNRINLFCVQTDRDAQRLMRLGVSGDKIKVNGNMKFDVTDYTDEKTTDCTDYKIKLGLEDNEKLLVAGSTHSGEEEIILNVYQELVREFPDLRLLIAPRHPERAKEIADLVLKNGFKSIFVSNLDLIPNTYDLRPIFILDSIGHLMNYYAIADIVFVGGSLVKKGGHNILEPAVLGKPIIFGPYMFNFRDIAELFLKNQAAILAHNPQELKEKVRDLLNSSSQAMQLSWRSKKLILENQGATQRNLEYINTLFNRVGCIG